MALVSIPVRHPQRVAAAEGNSPSGKLPCAAERCVEGAVWGSSSAVGGIEEEEEELSQHTAVASAAFTDVSPPGPANQGEEKMYVALGKVVKESRNVLLYALRNRPAGMKVVLVHVHHPSPMIPFMGAWFKPSQLSNHQVKMHRQQERDKVDTVMNDYMLICKKLQVQCEKLVFEKDDIAKGLIEIIEEKKITKLVMGAAAERHYSSKMKEPKSKTSRVVLKGAFQYCKIWFVCKGQLVCIRPPAIDGALAASPNNGSVQSVSNRSPSSYSSYSSDATDDTSVERLESDGGFFQRELGSLSEAEPSGTSILRNRLVGEEFLDEQPTTYYSSKSSFSTSDEDRQHHKAKESVLLEDEIGDLPSCGDLQYQVREAEREISNLRDELHEEARKCHDAKIKLLTVHQRARESEVKHAAEVKLRNDLEKMLKREKLEVEKLKTRRNEVVNKLHAAEEQKLALKIQIAECDEAVKDIEEKILEGLNVISGLRRQVEELQKERDIAGKEVDELIHMTEEPSCSCSGSTVFCEFSYRELVQATSNFSSSLQIGKGGYGNVYKGFLRHTTVAIKMLNPNGSQGISEFQQEVDILSRVRHPNLVNLIGACPKEWALVYEYLPNGSLEDHLNPKDNGTSLTWQLRTRISHQICTALAFLHSTKPHSIVHGDLKPANILLDSNMDSKLSDFGISRLLTHSCHLTTPKGTVAYMDPEFMSTGELTTQSDVYSFGVVLLRLVTGMAASGIVKAVRESLDKGRLHEIVDFAAGQWPSIQVQQLARLGIRCCARERSQRPDLVKDVLMVLKSLNDAASSVVYPSPPLRSPNECCVPAYFKCPILQEIMRDPQVAADGYTYEAEAIKGWLENYETSPMTNLRLPHSHLIPNFAIRSAIQEWLQHKQH